MASGVLFVTRLALPVHSTCQALRVALLCHSAVAWTLQLGVSSCPVLWAAVQRCTLTMTCHLLACQRHVVMRFLGHEA